MPVVFAHFGKKGFGNAQFVINT